MAEEELHTYKMENQTFPPNMNSNSLENSDLNNRISFEKLNIAETISRK